MKPMIQAHLVERDQFGFWTHPNYPDLADNCSSSEAQETLRRLGLELQNVFMESDAPRLYDSARSDQRYSEWIPTRPEGAGWFVLSIHDTDNGPVCQYVRPLGEHLSPIGLDAAAEQHERLLSEACAKALNQRDVAQARVAELEHVLRVVVNAADHGSWPTTVMHGIEKVREVLAGSAPPAKAQHSVPDGYRLVRLEHFAAIKAQLDPEQVDAYRGRNIYDEDKVYANWNKCRSALDEIKDVFQQIEWDTENELADLLAAGSSQAKPCPLCSSTNIRMLEPELLDTDAWNCAIECQDCQVHIGPSYCEPDPVTARYSAQVDWNRRPSAKSHADEREQFLMANLLAALEVALGNVAALAIVDRVRQVADRIYPTSNLSPVPQAWLDVQAERRRQITVEGFDTSNDDASAGQIAQAAGCYALHAGGIGTDWPGGIRNGSALFWPWDEEWWKPKSARENLVRAGALVLAEIERLDRSATEQGSTCCKGSA